MKLNDYTQNVGDADDRHPDRGFGLLTLLGVRLISFRSYKVNTGRAERRINASA